MRYCYVIPKERVNFSVTAHQAVVSAPDSDVHEGCAGMLAGAAVGVPGAAGAGGVVPVRPGAVHPRGCRVRHCCSRQSR